MENIRFIPPILVLRKNIYSCFFFSENTPCVWFLTTFSEDKVYVISFIIY